MIVLVLWLPILELVLTNMFTRYFPTLALLLGWPYIAYRVVDGHV